ncbi:hypothetical protein CAPN008_01340 [Capnocytophaga canis]|uniref:hypothetical protein n=1 Tax=Capnocytophaga canis TaxID=1848903 RepID=UPI001AD1C32F|nr:hypothetical protein [Capnocytophaga canis]GIM60084.1 hypothetical protein CAPN008_01340 [Capnocytophaga canis]
MAVATLNRQTESFADGMDNIVITNYLDGIRGGRTLNLTGFTEEVVKAGHIIIKEASSGDYKPMPVSGGNYASLPGGHSYAGVLVASITKNKPFAGIMTRGTVNINAVPFGMTSILTAVKTALPLVDFRND